MLKNQLLFFFLLLIKYGLAQSELPKLNPDGIYESQFSKVEEEQLIGKVKEVKKIVIPSKKIGHNGINLEEYYEISKNKHFFLDKKGNLRKSISYKRDTIIQICNFRKKKIIDRLHFEPCCLGYGKETFSYKKSKLVKYVIKDEKDSVLLVEKGVYDKNMRLIASIVNGFTRIIIKYPTQDSFFVAHYFYQNKDTVLNEAYSRKYLDGGRTIKSYTYQINQNKLGQPNAVQIKRTCKSDNIMTESYYSLDAGILHFTRSYKVMINENKKKYEVQSYKFAKDSTHFFYNIEGKLQKVVRYDVFNSKNNIISMSEYDDYGNIILINSPKSKKEQFIYLYDAHNNWIERQYLIDDKIMERTKRIIKYH